MHLNWRNLLWIPALVLWASCSPYNRLPDEAKMILGPNKGLIRGIDFDMHPDSVKAHETEKLFTESEYYLGYQKVLDSVRHMEVEYSFNNDDQLDFISIYYTINQADEVYDITGALTAYFDKKYGKSEVDELGWHTWKFDDTKGLKGSIEVVLIADITPDKQGVDLELVKYYTYE